MNTAGGGQGLDYLGDWAKMMKDFRRGILSAVNVSLVAKVVAFDGVHASVQPLAQVGEQKPAIINNVYVLDHVVDLKVNEVVFLVISDYPLEDFQHTNNVFTVSVSRRHSINDAVIVGRLLS
ncbi:MAG: hypothetical protein ACRC9Z_10520 [Weissella confusa]